MKTSLCWKIVLSFKPITTWRRIAGTRAAKKDCKYFPGGLFSTKWLILWFYGFNFMKLSIRFAVSLFTFVSLFIYWKGRKRTSQAYVSHVLRWFHHHEAIFAKPIDIVRLSEKINKRSTPFLSNTCPGGKKEEKKKTGYHNSKPLPRWRNTAVSLKVLSLRYSVKATFRSIYSVTTHNNSKGELVYN